MSGVNAPEIVLVVGEQGWRRALVEPLRAAGHTVHEAATGAEVLADSYGAVDLVLLAAGLSAPSAVELCRALKASTAFSGTPVALVFPRAPSVRERIDAMEAGAETSVYEPVPPEELVALAAAMLRLRQNAIAARRATERLEGLQRLTSALSAAVTTRDVAREVVAAGRALLGAQRAAVRMVTADGHAITLLAHAGFSAEEEERTSTLPLDGDLAPVRVFKRATPEFLEDVPAGSSGMRALALCPLSVRGQALGVLAFGYEAPREFSSDDRYLVELVADQCALALDRARLHEGEAQGRVTAEAHVTEQRRAHEQLRQVLEQMPVGVVLADPTGKLFLSNPAAEKIWGHPLPDTSAGVPAWAKWMVWKENGELYKPEELPLARSLKTGETIHNEEFIHGQPNGGRVFVSTTSAAIRDADGAIIGGIAVFQDITEERRAQEIQRRLLGIVSHDVRNPLAAISVGVAALKRVVELPDAGKRVVDRLDRSVGRMEQIIKDLLDFTTASARGIPVSFMPTDLHSICFPVVEELETSQPGRRIDYDGQGDGTGHWDPSRLQQAVANLLSNALQYSPPGSPVSLRWSGNATDKRVEVHNEGPPVPPELQARLFDPFVRGPQADADGAGIGGRRNLGLGLYIVREVLRAHSGTVELRSSDGEGTTFVLRLPRNPPEPRRGHSPR